VRDLNAKTGQLVQMLDRLLHPFAVLAEIEARRSSQSLVAGSAGSVQGLTTRPGRAQ
jgi:hypothetical protein